MACRAEWDLKISLNDLKIWRFEGFCELKIWRVVFWFDDWKIWSFKWFEVWKFERFECLNDLEIWRVEWFEDRKRICSNYSFRDDEANLVKKRDGGQDLTPNFYGKVNPGWKYYPSNVNVIFIVKYKFLQEGESRLKV